ncbi:hypothetical protein B0H13DRAFT_1851065 [Mycena leptocephala]|nr:hypothetical protein B0H13DRAFT_1851065 [Mycena leptocephala]
MPVLSKLYYIPAELQEEILSLLSPKDLLSLSCLSKDMNIRAQPSLLHRIIFGTGQSLINFVEGLTVDKLVHIHILQFLPLALEGDAAIGILGRLLFETAPYLIELGITDTAKTSATTVALQFTYPKICRISLVSNHAILWSQLPMFLTKHPLLENIKLLPITPPNPADGSTDSCLPAGSLHALKSIVCPIAWLPMLWNSAATMLRVEILSNPDIAQLVGCLFQSPMGANLVSIHMSGNAWEIIAFLGSISRNCTTNLQEISLYVLEDPPNLHEVLTLLLPVRGLVRFEFSCGASQNLGFQRPDARLLDSLSVIRCELYEFYTPEPTPEVSQQEKMMAPPKHPNFQLQRRPSTPDQDLQVLACPQYKARQAGFGVPTDISSDLDAVNELAGDLDWQLGQLDQAIGEEFDPDTLATPFNP